MSRAILILAVLLIVSVSVNLVLVVEMASGQPLLAGLGTENHAIQNVTNLVSMVAAVVGAVGLVVGVDQLRQSKNQARAQAIYNALKDTREATTTHPADWFNFYYALFEQKRLGVFSDDMWEPVRRDIEKMLATVPGQTYWAAHKGNFSDEFRDEIRTIPGGGVMPYFSNKTTDPAVDGHAREGGRSLALALRDIYDVVADLEVNETIAFDTVLGRASGFLQDSLIAYGRAEDAASPEPLDLGEIPAVQLRRLEPLLEAAERAGMRLEAFSDRDMFLLTRAGIGLLLNLVEDARRRDDTGFGNIDGILRAAMRAQAVSLACTRVLSQLYRGDYRYA